MAYLSACLFYISLSHIVIEYLHCISSLHIFIAHLDGVSLLHILKEEEEEEEEAYISLL
jgi:hypothetical protein